MSTKRRPRVVGRISHQAMFNRVVMDVIQMPLEIIAISDYVIPKAPLPEVERCCNGLFPFPAVGESKFDGLYDAGKVAFCFRTNNAMEMIVKNDIRH